MKKNNNLTILSIETSCDDTCIAILKIKNQKLKILSNIISSQVKIHKKYGGVYPFLAKREHQKNLPIVFKKALNKAGNPKLDLIAVTIGPGLEPCLWTGINFAKELAEKLQIPIMPVNHIEAHILANWLSPIRQNQKSKISPPHLLTDLKRYQKKLNLLTLRQGQKVGGQEIQKLFPAVCLVVSGGHTQLILMRDFGKYKILGETRDDAAGECFDKTARILGLGYPGGPIISQQAAKLKSKIKNQKSKIILPRPMIKQKNYDFSFSGLKTAVLYNYKNYSIQAMAAEVQQAIIDVLIHKTIKAAKDFQVKSIILGGGVTANKELRKQLKKRIKKEIPDSKFYIPDYQYCLDNAAMVGIAAYFHWLKNKKKKRKEIKASGYLRISKAKS